MCHVSWTFILKTFPHVEKHKKLTFKDESKSSRNEKDACRQEYENSNATYQILSELIMLLYQLQRKHFTLPELEVHRTMENNSRKGIDQIISVAWRTIMCLMSAPRKDTHGHISPPLLINERIKKIIVLILCYCFSNLF